MKFDITKPLNKVQSILAAVIVTALAFLVALIVQKAKDVPLDEATLMRTAGIRNLQVVGENLYYLENDGTLRCAQSDGDGVWSVSVSADSNFRATQAGLAVWRGSKLSIYDRSNGVVVGAYSASDSILDAVVGDTYTAVVVAPTNNSKVVITNKYGTEVEIIEGFNERTVLECSFFENRGLFWVMALDSTGTLPSCTVDIYKPSKKQTGSIFQMDQVFYRVIPRSGQICCVGTDYMSVHDYVGGEKENQRVQLYGWTLAAYESGSDDPLMLFAPNAQSEGEIEIRDLRCIRGTKEQMLHLPVKCSFLACEGDTIYGFSGSKLAVAVYGSHECNLYSMPVGSDGRPLEVTKLFGITSDRVAVVRSGSELYLVKLPEE